MRDSQGTLNAATRIWLDNLAMSSAPMMEINTDLLAAGEDPTDIHPWRVFLREGGDGSMPMVRWYQPIANANGLNQIVEIFRRFADETTSLPSYTQTSFVHYLHAYFIHCTTFATFLTSRIYAHHPQAYFVTRCCFT